MFYYPQRFIIPPRLDEATMSQPTQPRKPLGEPIEWTEEDLDALSAITDVDKEEGAAWWNRNAPPQARPLLDAVEEEGEEG